jgi:Lsr2
MARQTTITLVDDLDGSEAEEQVEFSVDGRTYEIDLSAANAGRLRDALAPFVSAARRSGTRRAATPGGQPSRAGSDRAQNQAIRKWAIAQGMKVSERGRIPTNVITAYHSAH